MRSILPLLLLPSLASAAVDVDLLLGQKRLDSDWSPVDRQKVVGGELYVRGSDWWIGPMLGYLSAKDSGSSGGVDVDAKTTEFYVGAEVCPYPSQAFQPYLALGLDHAKATATFTAGGPSSSDSDSGTGEFAEMGLRLILADHFAIGGLLHLSRVTLHSATLNKDMDAGGMTLAVVAGLHF